MDHSKVVALKEFVKFADNSIVSSKVLEKAAGGVTIFAFDKGQRLSEHTAPFDAIIQVVEGVGEIMINREPHLVSEGQMIIMPANIPHAVNAHEPFKMMLVMIKK